MKTERFLRLNLLISLLFAISLMAQNKALIEVKSAVDTSNITIGDRIHYSISISHAKGLRVERPGEGLNLGQFEIKSYDFPKPQEKNGMVTEKFNFTISVFDTGHFVIPPFPVAYFPDSSNAYKIIKAGAIDIYVRSLLSGADSLSLKDVKPPIDVPFNWKFVYSMLAIAVLVILAAWLGYRAYKQKQEKGYLFVPPPKPRPAHEIALEALDALYRSDLLEKGKIKKFYSELTAILRAYLEGRYFVQALEQTTADILRDMAMHIDGSLLENLAAILREADLVKFAKHKPSPERTEQIRQLTRSFVEDTMVVFEAETGQDDMAESTEDQPEKLLPEKTENTD